MIDSVFRPQREFSPHRTRRELVVSPIAGPLVPPPCRTGTGKVLGALVLPLLFGLAVVSEALQRSIGGAASAVSASVGVGMGNGGGGGTAAIIGGVGSAVGGTGGVGTPLDMGLLLEGASDVFDTLFVLFSCWYMLRFFR